MGASGATRARDLGDLRALGVKPNPAGRALWGCKTLALHILGGLLVSRPSFSLGAGREGLGVSVDAGAHADLETKRSRRRCPDWVPGGFLTEQRADGGPSERCAQHAT